MSDKPTRKKWTPYSKRIAALAHWLWNPFIQHLLLLVLSSLVAGSLLALWLGVVPLLHQPLVSAVSPLAQRGTVLLWSISSSALAGGPFA
jgi:hypothetical protein